MDIILTGKTGSGKSTIASILKKHGYQPILEYTTRPIRVGEKDGVDYHFVDDNTFDEMNASGQFIESSSFHTVHGLWKYGAAKSDFGKLPEGVICMGPAQVMQILKTDADVFVAFLDLPDNEVIKRISRRGDFLDEVERRLKADKQALKDIKPYADYVVDNTSIALPDAIAGWIIAEAYCKANEKAYLS